MGGNQKQKQTGVLKLADLETSLQASVQDQLNWQAKLRAAIFDAVSEEDVQAIVKNQVEQAKQGKESAVKFVMTHILGTQTPIQIKQTNIVTDIETAARLVREQ